MRLKNYAKKVFNAGWNFQVINKLFTWVFNSQGFPGNAVGQ